MALLKLDTQGDDVRALQNVLRTRGFNPGVTDGDFGPGTEAAVIAFQKSEGLTPDGIVGPQTLEKLGMPAAPLAAPVDITANVTAAQVSRMFPQTPGSNIKTNLPFVLQAMRNTGLGDKPMIQMALGTIRAEAASFEPISEGLSRYNTSPNGHPFDLYDNRRDLGNRGAPDGERFKGRGFVQQLTGRANYTTFSAELGMGTELVDDPEMANDPTIASRLLALFLKDKEPRIRGALASGDLTTARRLVNGGSHGLNEFSDAYRIGERVLPEA